MLDVRMLRRSYAAVVMFRLDFFFFQAEDGIRDHFVTGVQTCALLFSSRRRHTRSLCDWSSDVCSSDLKQKTAYEITVWLEFRRVLFRSAFLLAQDRVDLSGLQLRFAAPVFTR